MGGRYRHLLNFSPEVGGLWTYGSHQVRVFPSPYPVGPDLVSPVITATHAFLTQAQPAWVPYHTHVITRVGKSTLFGTVQAPVFVEDSGEWTELSVSPMNETEARAFCALIIAILFLYRVTVNFGIDWAKGAVKGKPKKVIRSSKSTMAL